MRNIDLLRLVGLICEDEDCTATHVDIDHLPEGSVFVEVSDD